MNKVSSKLIGMHSGRVVRAVAAHRLENEFHYKSRVQAPAGAEMEIQYSEFLYRDKK